VPHQWLTDESGTVRIAPSMTKYFQGAEVH
jgi:hypothetical protein